MNVNITLEDGKWAVFEMAQVPAPGTFVLVPHVGVTFVAHVMYFVLPNPGSIGAQVWVQQAPAHAAAPLAGSAGARPVGPLHGEQAEADRISNTSTE